VKQPIEGEFRIVRNMLTIKIPLVTLPKKVKDRIFVPSLAGVTNRERQVLQYVIDGNSNAVIAARLRTSVRTAKFHVSSLLKHFHVKDRVALRFRVTRMVQKNENLDTERPITI